MSDTPQTNLKDGRVVAIAGPVIDAVGVGNDSVLHRIVQMVAEAQRSQAPIQKLVDVVARYFVPAVILAVTLLIVGLYPNSLLQFLNPAENAPAAAQTRALDA